MALTRHDLERARPHWSKAFAEANPELVAGLPLAPAQAALPPSAAPGAKPAPVALKSPLAEIFEERWAALRGAALTPEYQFHPKRKWRFDYAIPEAMVAIELEGGIHQRKGHASPEGYIKDCRKYNAATALGWRVYRLASGMMRDGDVEQVCAAVWRMVLEKAEESL